MQASVTYFGHQIDARGIHITAEKVEAIQQAPAPKNVTELHSFLGLLNYYGKFMPNLASHVHPFNQLLREDQPWQWTDECDKAFKRAKEQLSQAPILVHYDPSQPIQVAGEASNYGVGAVLSHIIPGGKEHPLSSRHVLCSPVNEIVHRLKRRPYHSC